jgi:hypothetical protein
MSEFKIQEVKVHRTLEGTIFEIITAIILIVTYAVAIAKNYFDFDNFQGKHLATIVLSVISIVLLAVAYSPKNINIGGEPKNIRQVEISIRTVRVIAVELALFCLLMVAISPDNPIIHTAFGVTLVVTALISTIFIHKSK